MQKCQLGWAARPWSLMVVLAVAVGCGVDSSGEGSSLDGRTFLLQSAEGFTAVSGTVPRLRFASGELSVSAGCNSQGGDYSQRGAQLVVRGLGSTSLACDPELHTQDEWLATFITSSPRVTLDGDQLTLTGDEATLVFLDREVADPDQPLEGTLWIVDTLVDSDGASSVPAITAPEIQFDEASSSWHGVTGCVSLNGQYVVENDTVTLRSLVAISCTDPPSAMDMHVRNVMSEGVVTFEIDADRLTLNRGGLGLRARAQ